MSFETIKEFYQLGLWDAQQLRQLVQAGGLTAEQYYEITGEIYSIPKSKPMNTENRSSTNPHNIGVAQG
ncbi:XkdX family protein [Clostridium massiliamazoniense]|uniref:XkdX family protein n=1 Tax=Clostridium massiliamazoniense TaxID=1347366 RepID=UPI0006D7C4AB|nr:XkdX family protein [Clostridium massiliamazoniense]